jgi:sulfotransferase
MEKIFFQSSLPRAGSTLFQNLMAQNPDFYASPTSGMMELIYGARENYTYSPEFIAIMEKDGLKKAFAAFCDKGLHAYAATFAQKYYLDKGRSWGYYIQWLDEFMPYPPKVICMVRDIRDIYCSMEKIFRKNPDKAKNIINWAELKNTTVAKRIDFWSNTPPVGLAMERLQEIIHQGYDHKILFIKYEDLCLNPNEQMKRVYQYLQIPYFQHDFDSIPQFTLENDSVHGEYGDHIIRNRLELTPSTSNNVLGIDICNWIVQRYSWFYEYFKY